MVFERHRVIGAFGKCTHKLILVSGAQNCNQVGA